MNKYDDLELTILCCFLQKPKLLETSVLTEEHFVKHKRIYILFKTIYNKFRTLDFNIMYTILKNKYTMFEYIVLISQHCGYPSLFEVYEKQLINLNQESKKNKWIIEKVYETATNLYVRNIEVENFRNEIDKIYKDADEIFEKSK